MDNLPGMDAKVAWGDPDARLPDWRKCLRTREEEEDSDDAEDISDAHKSLICNMIGFDPSELDDDEVVEDLEEDAPLNHKPDYATTDHDYQNWEQDSQLDKPDSRPSTRQPVEKQNRWDSDSAANEPYYQLGESFVEAPDSLLEDVSAVAPGFSGIITDSIGRKYHFINGKRVSEPEHDQYTMQGGSNKRYTHHAPLEGEQANHLAWALNTRTATNAFREIQPRLSAPDGGFTLKPVSGQEPTTGYSVSIFPQRSFMKPASKLALKDVVRYYLANKELLKKHNVLFGGWHDPKTDNVFLDLSVRVDTEDEAKKLALEHDQIAYFDFKHHKSVEVNANATSGGANKSQEDEKHPYAELKVQKGYDREGPIVDVYKNPSPSQVKTLQQHLERIRGLTSKEGDVYLWDEDDAEHNQIRDGMDLPMGSVGWKDHFYIERGHMIGDERYAPIAEFAKKNNLEVYESLEHGQNNTSTTQRANFIPPAGGTVQGDDGARAEQRGIGGSQQDVQGGELSQEQMTILEQASQFAAIALESHLIENPKYPGKGWIFDHIGPNGGKYWRFRKEDSAHDGPKSNPHKDFEEIKLKLGARNFGGEMSVYKNPTMEQLHALWKNVGPMRGIMDDDGNMYFWDYDVEHMEVFAADEADDKLHTRGSVERFDVQKHLGGPFIEPYSMPSESMIKWAHEHDVGISESFAPFTLDALALLEAQTQVLQAGQPKPPGFTGIIIGKDRHKYYYENGERVSQHKHDAAVKGGAKSQVVHHPGNMRHQMKAADEMAQDLHQKAITAHQTRQQTEQEEAAHSGAMHKAVLAIGSKIRSLFGKKVPPKLQPQVQHAVKGLKNAAKTYKHELWEENGFLLADIARGFAEGTAKEVVGAVEVLSVGRYKELAKHYGHVGAIATLGAAASAYAGAAALHMFPGAPLVAAAAATGVAAGIHAALGKHHTEQAQANTPPTTANTPEPEPAETPKGEKAEETPKEPSKDEPQAQQPEQHTPGTASPQLVSRVKDAVAKVKDGIVKAGSHAGGHLLEEHSHLLAEIGEHVAQESFKGAAGGIAALSASKVKELSKHYGLGLAAATVAASTAAMMGAGFALGEHPHGVANAIPIMVAIAPYGIIAGVVGAMKSYKYHQEQKKAHAEMKQKLKVEQKAQETRAQKIKKRKEERESSSGSADVTAAGNTPKF